MPDAGKRNSLWRQCEHGVTFFRSFFGAPSHFQTSSRSDRSEPHTCKFNSLQQIHFDCIHTVITYLTQATPISVSKVKLQSDWHPQSITLQSLFISFAFDTLLFQVDPSSLHLHQTMASMLRPIARASGRSSAFLSRTSAPSTRSPLSRLMSTQSGDDVKPPSALATLYLEDGSKFVGRSFGSHEAAVDGEVRIRMQFAVSVLIDIWITYLTYVCAHHLCPLRLSSPPEWLVILKRWLILRTKGR